MNDFFFFKENFVPKISDHLMRNCCTIFVQVEDTLFETNRIQNTIVCVCDALLHIFQFFLV